MMKKSKLSKEVAHFLLEYIEMEDCAAKRNIEILCSKELKIYFDWIDKYSKEYGLSQEQILFQMIES